MGKINVADKFLMPLHVIRVHMRTRAHVILYWHNYESKPATMMPRLAVETQEKPKQIRRDNDPGDSMS